MLPSEESRLAEGTFRMTFRKQQKSGGGGKVRDCQELGGRGRNRGNTEDFQGSETLLCDVIMADTFTRYVHFFCKMPLF